MAPLRGLGSAVTHRLRRRSRISDTRRMLAQYVLLTYLQRPRIGLPVVSTENLRHRCGKAMPVGPILADAMGLITMIGTETIMSQKKILIVDDSLVILKALSIKLSTQGYKALTAEDGGTAVSLARREKPDLIILDISFPPDVAHGGGVAWDGFLIMDWLRRMDEAKGIPIIVVTGGDPVQYKDRSFAAGAVAFFHKPIDNAELLDVIRQTLGETAPENPLSV